MAFSQQHWGGGGSGSGLWEKWLKKVKFRLVKHGENEWKNTKKKSFFSIHNVNLKKSVDNFCSIVKLHFLKTKIQNRIYRDFEHHFLTNFGKIIFFNIPYIWEFYGFFRKKQQKKHEYSIFLYTVFSTFFWEKNRKMIFFSYCVGTCTYWDFDSI